MGDGGNNNRGSVPSGTERTCSGLRRGLLPACDESFLTLFHLSTDAMIIHDGTNTILANEAFGNLFRRSAGSLTGENPLQFTPASQSNFAVEQIAKGTEDPYAIPCRRHDGSIFMSRIEGRNVIIGGQSYRLVRVSEITELGQVRKELDASEARFQKLIAESGEAVVVLDANGLLTFATPALSGILGYPPEAFRERMRYDLIYEEDIPEFQRVWLEALQSPGEPLSLTIRINRGDNQVSWIGAVITNQLDDPAIEGIVVNVRDVTQQRSLEDELKHLALHDALTGLPNRTLLVDRLENALRQSRLSDEHIGVLTLDLDNFQHINERFGHEAGDGILQSVVDRLKAVLEPVETLARSSGDEFIVMIPSLEHGRDARLVAQAMQTVMLSPFPIEEGETSIKMSIGIATSGSGIEQADGILRRSAAALYLAKQAGRSPYVLYSDGMTAEVTRRLALESDLLGAAERGEFVLHYQPIVSLNSGEIDHVEALVRWNHPVYGLISPNEFIPMAEEANLIVNVGEWVLREAIRQLKQWGADSPAVAVNFSALQFKESTLFDSVSTELRRSDVRPDRLHVEITEGVIIDNVDTTISNLKLLRDAGVQIVIDDFGTGYSSLRYLREFPVDAIKIDRSFVRGLESDGGAVAIVEGITSLAHAIGLIVTAEGIETAEQLALLKDIGCDFGQGFLLAYPTVAGKEAPRVDVTHPRSYNA